MAINTLTIAWLSRLTAKGLIAQGQSIVEFSPQDIMSPPSAVRYFGLRHNSVDRVDQLLAQIYEGETPRPDGSAAFYALFGTARYRSVDLIDRRADWIRDFNDPVRLNEQFDIATNFGTAEHVFNVGHVFRSMHDAVKPGGVMLHVLPAFGDIDHGFYNIHPTTYVDLAAANDYVIEDFCYGDRWDIRNKLLDADATREVDFEAFPVRLEHLRDRPLLQRLVTELFVKNYHDPDTQRLGQTYPGVLYDYCCIALRKTTPNGFRLPMQGYYGGGAAQERLGWRWTWASLKQYGKQARLRISQEGLIKGVSGVILRRLGRLSRAIRR